MPDMDDLDTIGKMITKAVIRVSLREEKRRGRELERQANKLRESELRECQFYLGKALRVSGIVEGMLPVGMNFSDNEAARNADDADDADRDAAWEKRVAAEAIWCGFLKEMEIAFRNIKSPDIASLAEKYPPGSQFEDE